MESCGLSQQLAHLPICTAHAKSFHPRKRLLVAIGTDMHACNKPLEAQRDIPRGLEP